MSDQTPTDQSFWEPLIEPDASTTGMANRRRARVLAGVSLALLLSALVTVGIGLARSNPAIANPALVFAGLFMVTYLFSRTGRQNWGARLLVLGLMAGCFALLLSRPDAAQVAANMPFLLLPILLSALLLSARITAGLAAATSAGLLALPLILPWLGLGDYLTQFAAVLVISILAAISGFLREYDVVTIQHQTDDLSHYSQSLEAEVRNVITTAQVGQAITGTRDLSQLLKQIVGLIAERFDFYHVQVFLVDDSRQYAVLRESTGEAGQKLLERGHRLGVGSQSVIGQVTSKGQPLIVFDTDSDPAHRRNDLLPNTRSEMALPLIAGGQVIGALDIQGLRPNAFKESDLRVFQTMADQLAIAIENARLFERAQRDLQEIELLNRRLTGEGWRRFEASQPGGVAAGYEATSGGIRAISPVEELPEGGEDANKKITMPLVVRGEPIGVLDVTSRSGEPPSEELQSMLEAVAERVALALDSTRLGDSALRQVEREKVLGRLSAELQATTDLDVILRVAAREASRALGAPRGFVHLIMEVGADKTQTD